MNNQKYSLERLDRFKTELSNSQEVHGHKNLCIYTTGSYGRLEAAEFSDIDLFFIYKSNNNKKAFSKISKTLIDADIINICREMKFPEFSGDGEYLEIHDIENIHKELGSRKDDYYNYFTARMLLLLESKPIYNEVLYKQIIRETIEKYYTDFHKHEKAFEPVFIVNDIIRFWRTMCLNYEHNRNRKPESIAISKEEEQAKKLKSHIKNLKLRFSRKLTCYSFLLSILYQNDPLNPHYIESVVYNTPLERLDSLKKENPKITSEINKLKDTYFWFLEKTQVDEENLMKWVHNKTRKDEAFDKSREFAMQIFDIMIKADKNRLMYFLI